MSTSGLVQGTGAPGQDPDDQAVGRYLRELRAERDASLSGRRMAEIGRVIEEVTRQLVDMRLRDPAD